MRNLISIPFLLLPFIAFNLLLAFKPGLLAYDSIPPFTVELFTANVVRFSVSDILVASAVLLLVLQVYKIIYAEKLFFHEYLGSILILLVLITEFFMFRSASNSHCILLVFVSLLDVIFMTFSKKSRRKFRTGSIY